MLGPVLRFSCIFSLIVTLKNRVWFYITKNQKHIGLQRKEGRKEGMEGGRMDRKEGDREEGRERERGREDMQWSRQGRPTAKGRAADNNPPNFC